MEQVYSYNPRARMGQKKGQAKCTALYNNIVQWHDETLYFEDWSGWPSCVCILCNNVLRKLSVHLSSCWGDGFSAVSAVWMAAHCISAPFIPFLWVCVMRVMLLTSSWSHTPTTNQLTANSHTMLKHIHIINGNQGITVEELKNR